MDNIFVERLRRSLKYEEVHLHADASIAEARAVIGASLDFYNTERQHQSLGYRAPREIYQEGLWIYGRSALPAGCASAASRASSESGEMLAFAHIPRGTTNHGFDLDEVNSRQARPAVPPAIEAGTETDGAHLNKLLRLSHKRGPPQVINEYPLRSLEKLRRSMSYPPNRNRDRAPPLRVRIKEGGSPTAGRLQNRIAINDRRNRMPKITDRAAGVIVPMLAVTPVAALRIQACVPKTVPKAEKAHSRKT